MSFLRLKQGASASWYEANHALVLLSPFSSADGADSSHLFYAILSLRQASPRLLRSTGRTPTKDKIAFKGRIKIQHTKQKILSGFRSLEHGDFPMPRTASWAGCELQAVTNSTTDQRPPLPFSFSMPGLLVWLVKSMWWMQWDQAQQNLTLLNVSEMLLTVTVLSNFLPSVQPIDSGQWRQKCVRLPAHRIWICLLIRLKSLIPIPTSYST